MTDQLHVYTKSVEDVLEENQLGGNTVEHVCCSVVRCHIYLVRYRSKVIACVGRILNIGDHSFSACPEVLESLSELLDLS